MNIGQGRDPAGMPSMGYRQHLVGGHIGHRLMMIACCIPMLVIAVVLFAIGIAGAGFLLIAVGCTAMMALMMGNMGRGGQR